VTSLLREIQAIVASEGPIGVDRYMAIALGHPVHGYYRSRDPLGAAGDFTTAPEISQMFGELLGLWSAAIWMQMGRPEAFVLAEAGPGRGTLMADALRATARVPGFREACSVHLVETSPTLRARQREALAGQQVEWHERMEDLPGGPLLLLANEFLDALPIRQFVRAADGWHERVVGFNPAGALAFGLAPHTATEIAALPAPEGAILETCPAAQSIVASLAERLVERGGAALFVDYGPARDGFGDTLQAVRSHGFADPLADPGEADLTAHVHFGALARIAAGRGAATHGPTTQGRFLDALGIRTRAAALARDASAAQRAAIEAALARLTGPEAMGDLFKAFAIADPRLGPLPGLPPGDGAPSPG
jgi:SAM-dependent MidA family methyltransferase